MPDSAATKQLSNEELLPRGRWLLAWAKRIFGILGIGFLIYTVTISWEPVEELLSGARLDLLVLALTFYAFAYVLTACFNIVLLRGMNADVRFGRVISTTILRLPMRYIPGGLWHVAARVHDLKNERTSARILVTLGILDTVIPPCVASAVGGGLLLVLEGAHQWRWMFAAGVVGGLALLLCFPVVLRRFVLGPNVRISAATYIGGSIVALCSWGCACVAFLCYFGSFAALTFPFRDTAIFLFAKGVGGVAVFAPQGMGVFETVAASLKSAGGDMMPMIALVSGFRLLGLLADLLLWLAARLWMTMAPYRDESVPL